MRSILAIASVAAACSLPAVAHADQTPGRLSVTATIGNACDIGGGPSLELDRGLLDFGTHRLFDGANGWNGREWSSPVRATMPVLCSNSHSAPLVSFGQGLHPTGKQRNLQGPRGSLVPYDLLRGRSPAAGSWDENAYPIAVVGGQVSDIPVYGVIRAVPSNAEDGLYTDTVVVQIDF